MEKKKGKRPGGRKKLKPELKRKKHDYYMNDQEYNQLLEYFNNSGYPELSAYIRETLLNKTDKNAKHINPIEFLKDIKKLSMEVNKIGVNINQLARHVNELTLQNVIPVNVAEGINEKLAIYLSKQDEIILKLKEVVKK